ncbi:aliphatic sulfonate ABC transporter substrate-binding protein [Methylopila sp. M107]|uniref:aliphatic sulfonate ABC transporter substrate-binding protein n=1 Tax=Methylopila sp. M107 TaxID=1101190 RepID=UPI00037CE8B8|nr:aliphatic sulfonate ABC transporter substrate-binding protein [Methylopila sp. M107]
MLTRRATIAALAAAPFVMTSGRSLAETPKAVRIGFQKNGSFLVAKLRGEIDRHFAEKGVEVEWREFTFGPPLVEALNVGAIDLGSVGDTPPIFAQAAKSKFVYAAAQNGTGAGIIVPKDSSIRAVPDLVGKRVAIPKGSVAHNITAAALEKAGFSFKDITPVYLAPADAQGAFRQGAVDAWTIWDPFFAVAEETVGAKLIALATDIAPQYGFALASRDFAERHGDTLAEVIDQISRAGAWADQNRDKTAELFAEATGTPLAAQRRAVARAGYKLRPLDETIVENQQKSADRFYALGLIPAKIEVAEAVWRR